MTPDISVHPLKSASLPLHGIAGLIVVLCAEAALILDVQIVRVYFTPTVWTGYILFVDGLLDFGGRSIIKNNPRELLLMLPWSVVCWLVFEAYNLKLQNWTYTGLPDNLTARWIGYIWSFATIFPAILLTARLIELKLPPRSLRSEKVLSKPLLFALMLLGLVLLSIPLVVPQETSSTMFAFVWIGFIFLLDPINYWKGGTSLLRNLVRGESNTLLALMLAGFVCGVLWEFWNYWATAKWIYSVPISFAGPKVFEMPLLGYLGFLPFAVECYVMNEFLYTLIPGLRSR